MTGSKGRIAYLVHDINDAAVARRVTMFETGGADVTVVGFRRDARIPTSVGRASVIDLGLTEDARLAKRAQSILGVAVRPSALFAACVGCNTIVARNLESLVLGARVRRQRPDVRLVYECLDIHRMLLGTSLAAKAVQYVERRLLARIDMLLISSPAFSREHFAARLRPGVLVALVENKVLALGGGRVTPPEAPRPPWTIGWFGNLRCRRTFDLLRALAARLDGTVNILIAGRASPAEFVDFERQVEAAPHCTYLGSYAPADLPALYARCHFAWAIDYFEEGLNSSWLLPNRLYEASSAHVVPIALRSVETGRWLAAHDAGLLLGDQDVDRQMTEQFTTLTPVSYAAMRSAVAAIPDSDLFTSPDDCRALTSAVTGA